MGLGQVTKSHCSLGPIYCKQICFLCPRLNNGTTDPMYRNKKIVYFQLFVCLFYRSHADNDLMTSTPVQSPQLCPTPNRYVKLEFLNSYNVVCSSKYHFTLCIITFFFFLFDYDYAIAITLSSYLFLYFTFYRSLTPAQPLTPAQQTPSTSR